MLSAQLPGPGPGGRRPRGGRLQGPGSDGARVRRGQRPHLPAERAEPGGVLLLEPRVQSLLPQGLQHPQGPWEGNRGPGGHQRLLLLRPARPPAPGHRKGGGLSANNQY